MIRRLTLGAAFATLLLAIVAARVIVSARSEWRVAQALEGSAQIEALGRAARLHAPGNPFSRRAVEVLAALARGANDEEALAALRELRSALLATRSFYTPHRALLREANRAIAQRMGAREVAAGEQPSLGAAIAWHQARLEEDFAPSVAWSVVALLGLALWIGSALRLARGHFAPGAEPRRYAWALASGLALFFLGLGCA